LNVLYDGDACGPYRDWIYEEWCFQADGTDVAPGFRWCPPGTPPRTICESGVDGGLRQVGRAAADRQATAEPAPGEIEQLFDHPQSARGARGDAGGRLVLDLGQCSASQDDVGCRENRAQRVAQVVGKHSDEELAQLLSRLEDIDLGASRPELRRPVVAVAACLVSLAAGVVALSGRSAGAPLVVFHNSP